jgi:hypothetical protein
LTELGENTNNEEVGAADRPELFQEADSAEAREDVVERSGTGVGMRGMAFRETRVFIRVGG